MGKGSKSSGLWWDQGLHHLPQCFLPLWEEEAAGSLVLHQGASLGAPHRTWKSLSL